MTSSCCLTFRRSSRSSARSSALRSDPPAASPSAANALTQVRRVSPLIPSSRATSARVRPEEVTSLTASRLNSSEYTGFCCLPTTRHHFLVDHAIHPV